MCISKVINLVLGPVSEFGNFWVEELKLRL